MVGRLAFVFLVALFIFQMLVSDASVVRRDAPDASKPTDAGQTIDEALQSFKSSMDDLIKNIQSNELFQNVSQSLKSFGEQVQTQGQQLVDKIQTASKTN